VPTLLDSVRNFAAMRSENAELANQRRHIAEKA
jgi:hypothetical protein